MFTREAALYSKNIVTFTLYYTHKVTTLHYATLMLLTHRKATILQLLIVGNETSYKILQGMTLLVQQLCYFPYYYHCFSYA
jgi:hypothetical protein